MKNVSLRLWVLCGMFYFRLLLNKEGGYEWVQEPSLSQGYWVLYVTGEHTAQQIWLEFPDNNTKLILNLYG